MNFADIIKFIETKTAGKFSIIEEREVILVSPANWAEISTLLKNESELDFDYLMCISSYDKGDNKTYGVAYNFFSLKKQHYLEVRVALKMVLQFPL